MTKKQLCRIGLGIFAAGVFILWLAPNVGNLRADLYLSAHGGFLDTSDYIYVKESACLSCQIIGGIVAFFGALGVALAFFFHTETAEASEEPKAEPTEPAETAEPTEPTEPTEPAASGNED